MKKVTWRVNEMNTKRAIALGAAAMAAVALAACGSAAPSSSGGASGGGQSAAQVGAHLGTPSTTIQATDDLKFAPTTTTVKVNDIVEWTNTGSVPHNITFDSPNTALDDTTFNGGNTWQVRFTQAGTYQYKCTFHPGMNGTVTVS